MPPKEVVLGHHWVVKIFSRAILHTEFLHHAPGFYVGQGRESDDLLKSGPFEPVSQRFVGSFGRISLTPFLRTDPSGNFSAGAER